MNNRDVAIDVYNRLNRWSHGALTYFAVGIIEDELDMAFPEGAKNTEQQVQSNSRKKEKPSCLGDVMDEETLIDIRRMCEIVLNNTFGNHELDSLAWYVGHHPLILNPDNAKQQLQPNLHTNKGIKRRQNMEELFERYYDNPVDNDGNQKPNKSLGAFEIIETLESDFYNSMRIAKSADNKIYLVIEREISGYNGGTRLRLLEIKNLSHLTTAST